MALGRLPAAAYVPGTALLYFLLGWLALQLAIAPGYASPIWPAAAVALVAILVFGPWAAIGVGLGSLCVNLDFGALDPARPELWPAVVLLPAAIGFGAALGALVGAALVRRCVGFPAELSGLQSIGRFLLLAGPVSCLVSPSVGVSVLVAQGAVTFANAPYNWLTWWVGDSLGVLIFGILLLPFVSGNDGIWRARRRIMPLSLLSLGALMVLLYLRISAAEIRQQQSHFMDHAAQLQGRLESHMREQIEVLHGAADLFSSPYEVSRAFFGSYAAGALRRHPSIQALSWSPRVAHDERQILEARARSSGLADFAFKQLDADGQMQVAEQRDAYQPVYFIEPLMGNEEALGFDLQFNEPRRRKIALAQHTGRPVATAPVTLVQETGSQLGVIIFVPVANALFGGQPHTGVVAGAFRARDWVAQTLKGRLASGLVLRVSGDAEGAEVLYESGPAAPSSPFEIVLPIAVADQTWWLELRADQDFLARSRSYVPWATLVLGLLFVTLLGAFLLTITGASYRTQRSNQQLRSMLKELQQTQSELVETKRLVSLGAMVSGLAHELNTPIGVAITASSTMPADLARIEQALAQESLTQEGLQAALSRWQEAATINLRNLNRAAELVRTFKSVVADPALHEVRAVDLGQLISETLSHIELLNKGQDNGVTVDFTPSVVMIDTIPDSVAQLIINLYNNAVLHGFNGGSGRIRIELSASEEGARIVFADNGKGIPATIKDRIFEPFFTTRRGHGGTGLGLHIVHNLVRQQLGGRITCSSVEEQGATFQIDLPKKINQKPDAAGTAGT